MSASHSAATEDTAKRVPNDRSGHLKITEIFRSIQGEGDAVGWPSMFVRLTGCPLRCTYCDTEYAFFGGEWMSFDDILHKVDAGGVRHVCVTGGEPLAQKRCHELLKLLCDSGYRVSLETSGAMDLAQVDSRVAKVMDLKTPDSGESERNRWDNLEYLTARDQIKFVICSEKDFEWVRDNVSGRGLHETCQVLVSPSFGQVQPRQLAEWVLECGLPVRVQVQLHKLLWGDEPGR